MSRMCRLSCACFSTIVGILVALLGLTIGAIIGTFLPPFAIFGLAILAVIWLVMLIIVIIANCCGRSRDRDFDGCNR